MKKVKYSIIEDGVEDGLPAYFVLRNVYFFGINLIGELFGVDGCPHTPFQDLENAQDYKKLLENR